MAENYKLLGEIVKGDYAKANIYDWSRHRRQGDGEIRYMITGDKIEANIYGELRYGGIERYEPRATAFISKSTVEKISKITAYDAAVYFKDGTKCVVHFFTMKAISDLMIDMFDFE